jgi:hypothetical protein
VLWQLMLADLLNHKWYASQPTHLVYKAFVCPISHIRP